jgi:hypothetical protein
VSPTAASSLSSITAGVARSAVSNEATAAGCSSSRWASSAGRSEARSSSPASDEIRKGDYVELIATMDILAVPVCYPSELSTISNYHPHSVHMAVHEATPETLEFADKIKERWGSLHAHKTPADFRQGDIKADRALIADPDYQPQYLPMPTENQVEIELSPVEVGLLHGLMKRDFYGATEDRVVVAAFMRWIDANRMTRRYSKVVWQDAAAGAVT